MLKSVSYETFLERAKGGGTIPVFQEYLADRETPVSVLEKLEEEENLFLLESVEGSERWARYSFIGVAPSSVVIERNGVVTQHFFENGEDRVVGADTFSFLRDTFHQMGFVPAPELPPMQGGAIGFVSYDAVRKFEPKVNLSIDPDIPEICFMLTDTLAIFDNVKQTVTLCFCAHLDSYSNPREAFEDAKKRIQRLYEQVFSTRPGAPDHSGSEEHPVRRFHSEMSCDDFLNIVEKCKEDIRNGECIQVVPSQKFTAETTASPFSLYRALRLINPSPYTFFMKFGGKVLIGSSPEELVKLTGRRASVRPIAGTRPRGTDEATDMKAAADLIGNEKERAEHVMLVDLGRNDVGRVSKPGTVQVREFMAIERYSHVMHLVSHIESDLAEGKDAFDLFRAAFPAGTLSGAPKVRAMQLIAAYEKSPRGVYGGAAGYFSFSGGMDFAIVIRTMLVEGEKVTMRAGCGIVADSNPMDEYQETINKAKAVFQAVQFAEQL